jgi:hypothetical protein
MLPLSVFAHCSIAGEEARPYETHVTAPGAPVLSGPGTAFYAVDTLAEGDVVEVYREQPGGWLGIRPPADSFSWIFGLHVKLLENGLAEVDKDDVASRIGSRISDQRNAVQVRLKKGEIVEILGEQTIDGQTWYKIAPPAGEFRWIHERYIEKSAGSVPPNAAAPPVITVPVDRDSDADDVAPISLVADSQPAADESWRAAPPKATAPEAAADPSPDSQAPVVHESPVVPGSPDAAPASNVRGPLDLAPAASANSSIPITPPSPPAAPVSESLVRRLTDFEMRLSRIVVEPPATWQIEPLASEVQQLFAQSSAAADRNAVQTTLAKIERFADIGRRYRQMGPMNAAGSGDSRAASGGSQTATFAAVPSDMIGPDGQRFDAVGVLRPVVSKRAGAPQFALLNERGQVVSFVTPTPDINLQPYVGRRIGVNGNRGYIPEFQRTHVTAGRVAPFEGQLLR